MGRRGVGALLLGAAVLAFAVMLVVDPLPTDYEQWDCCGGHGGPFMVARGPIVARYDASTDTTVAAMACAHGSCSIATQIAGNVTHLPRGSHLLATHGVPVRGGVDLAEPLFVPGSVSPDTNLTQMTAARFEVKSAYLPLLFHQATFILALAGVLLLAGARDPAFFGGLLNAGIALVFGTMHVATDLEGGWFLLVLSVPLGIFAIVATLFGRGHRHLRLAAVGTGCVTLGLLFTFFVANRYFVHPPTM